MLERELAEDEERSDAAEDTTPMEMPA
jgi:hypothetical protein